MKEIIVALVRNKEKILVIQSPDNPCAFGFISDELKDKETTEDAISRIIKEKLSSKIRNSEFYKEVVYEENEQSIKMVCYWCLINKNNFETINPKAKWITYETFASISWLPQYKFLIEKHICEWDSYYLFLNHFNISKEDLYKWGIENIIFPDKNKINEEWDALKERINNHQKISIRGYGRDGEGTDLFVSFYKEKLGIYEVKRDSTNNAIPKMSIQRMTKLVRNENLYNYQISHIWGKTKNVYLFGASWNICYMPKIMDPFSGHETKGFLPIEFQKHLKKEAFKRYSKYIAEYNKIISELNIETKLNEFCNENKDKFNEEQLEKFKEDALLQFSPIDEETL